MTIIEAIKLVIKESGKPLTAKQIHSIIVAKDYYMFGAKNPGGVVAGLLRRHCLGIDFPSSSPVKHFKLVAKNLYDIRSIGDEVESKPIASDDKDKLPEEIIHSQYKVHIKSLEQILINTILSSDPVFFEQLVVDLLLKMGYGDNGSGKRTKKSSDGGIDGEILQDSLGFDRIYIQAKRYSENPIGRPAIQQFVGALENITKGVFITTSSFTREAKEYALKQQQKTLVLIDGDRLAKLMIDHGVGVQEVKTLKIFKIDQNYFSEGLIS